MKLIFFMLLSVFSFLATANCPSEVSISNLNITKYGDPNINGVFFTQFLMAIKLEETNGVKLNIIANNNPNECVYLFENVNTRFIKSALLTVDSGNNKFDMKVTLLEPMLDGFGAYIHSVLINGRYTENGSSLEIDKNSNDCYTLYNGDQWWGSSWIIFRGADSGTFTLLE